MKNWYKIESKAGDRAEIWIYDEIGEDYWTGGGVTAKSFQKDLAAVKASQIDLHINSPGGNVFDGIAIYNLLKQHPATITTYIDGIAASIASVIALSGDTVQMAENALFMIHNPSGVVMGTATDMRDFADTLDKVAGSLITTYTGKTEHKEDEITSWMEAETWFNADEAFEAGFIDEITDRVDMAACAKFAPVMAKAGFKNVPEILTPKATLTPKDAEKALRDAGFSRKQAKVVIAKGFGESQRDVDDEPQRDVAQPKPIDSVAALLLRAELVAPTKV